MSRAAIRWGGFSATLVVVVIAVFLGTRSPSEDISHVPSPLVGTEAPDFSATTLDGATWRLRDHRGSVVVVNFWASWCGPCRRANPAVVKMYKEYSGKKFKGAKNGFTVVSVSMDKNKEAWINAIKADNLNWPYHMSDLGFWQSKAAAEYGVNFVPQCFLIDANGVVIGKYNHAEDCIKDIERLLAE